MFLDAGAEEIMVVAAVALIFVGPKDLPVVLRKVGQFTAKMRGLAAEFRASFDEMARQSELDELKREVEALRRGDAVKPVTQEIDDHFESLHREFGAAPPAGFGAREGEVVAGPDSSSDPAPAHMLPKPADPAPPVAADAEAAATPPAPKAEESAG
jgi:sec-independent protein translocase protein TatB